jgi:hypothetical protein
MEAKRLWPSSPYPGERPREAYTWLTEAVGILGLDAARLTPRKHYTIPDHPVAAGAPFSADIGSAVAELARYWSNAAAVLDETARVTPGASAGAYLAASLRHRDAHPPARERARAGVGRSASASRPATTRTPSRTGTSDHTLSGDQRPSRRSQAQAIGIPRVGWGRAPRRAISSQPGSTAQVAAFVESGIAACRMLLGG